MMGNCLFYLNGSCVSADAITDDNMVEMLTGILTELKRRNSPIIKKMELESEIEDLRRKIHE